MHSAGLLVIPTFQRSQNDLVKMGEVIETEKDLLLERVRLLAWGLEAFCPALS